MRLNADRHFEISYKFRVTFRARPVEIIQKRKNNVHSVPAWCPPCRVEMWPVEVDGTIFSVGRVGIPERGQVHRQFRCGARAWDRRARTTDGPHTVSFYLSFALLRRCCCCSSPPPPRLPRSHRCPRLCAHMCAGHEVALLACRRAREPLACPLPRGSGVGAALLPTVRRSGGKAMRCDAGAGMRVAGRGVAISTVPSSPENERNERASNRRPTVSSTYIALFLCPLCSPASFLLLYDFPSFFLSLFITPSLSYSIFCHSYNDRKWCRHDSPDRLPVTADSLRFRHSVRNAYNDQTNARPRSHADLRDARPTAIEERLLGHLQSHPPLRRLDRPRERANTRFLSVLSRAFSLLLALYPSLRTSLLHDSLVRNYLESSPEPVYRSRYFSIIGVGGR